MQMKTLTPGDGDKAMRRLLEDRERRIRIAAYFKAERRGFAPGRELEDWLEAEKEEDARTRPVSAD
ncbi:MAG: DUF2934 domain-containing protein [Chromatiaceae bacterium]